MTQFWIFDGRPGDREKGNGIGPFTTQDEAVEHADKYTAGWAPWFIGEVTPVYVHPSEDEGATCPTCSGLGLDPKGKMARSTSGGTDEFPPCAACGGSGVVQAEEEKP